MNARVTGRNHWAPMMALAACGLTVAAPARADEPGKEVTVSLGALQTQRINWKPASAHPRLGNRGPGCAQIVASLANQFNNIDTGSEITLQAGMVEGEGFGSTFTVADPVPSTPTVNEAFPIEVNLVEFIAGTCATLSGSNGLPIRLGWAIEVWDGEPNVGTSSIVFSVESDPDPNSTGLPGDMMLQRVSATPCSEINVLLGGASASAGKVQFSVDSTADPADRMIVPGNATDGSGNKLNTFTIVAKITHHNLPGASACDSVDLCNNAFMATEGSSVNGSANPNSPTFPTKDWLLAVPCAGGAPGGYSRFSSLSTTFRPHRDVLQQVTYTPAFCAGIATGACCAGSGSCSVTTQGACSGTSSYQGDSTTCGASTCPTGACCTAAGACSITTVLGCTIAYQGNGTVCSPNPCPQPTGACCATTGVCSVTSALNCGTGTFGGAGSGCTAQSCPGACCIGTGCLSASPGDCSGVGGTYQGNASACVGGSCPSGACCIAASGACSISSPAACVASGGHYGGNSSACNTTFCPLPTGACCATNGFCLTGQTQAGCLGVGFAWQGGGTVCSPNPCAAAGVCCRGTTCAAGVAQASCTAPAQGIGAAFVSASAVCNSTGVSTTPCCYADFNKASGITVQDIFDFLGAWFNSSPYCVVGGAGTGSPVVQDIFSFLNAWFSGC